MSFPHVFSGNPPTLEWIPAVVYPHEGGGRNDRLIKQMKTYYIYLVASKKNGTLYLGVTNDLVRRIWQHKNDVHEGFTKKYGVHRLVWYEGTTDVETAIRREKQMKKWRRQWKIKLIEKENPDWRDLYDELI